jgi:beta-N-acetylhexosaminidase
MHEAGMAATGKHFPGHGAVLADSHHELPVDERSYEDIAQWDLVPFERMIHAGLAAVMMAHVIYSRVDPSAAGFSPFWIREVLRKRLEFQGVVFSDDLSMAAAACAGGYQDRARTAMEAGCDMVLVCNQREPAAAVADALLDYINPVTHSRLVRMHGHPTRGLQALQSTPRWEQAVAAVQGYEEMPELDLG